MGTDVAVGLFALGGVVVGAFATTGSQLFLDWKRERRELARARRSVSGELLQVEMIFRAAAGTGHLGVGAPEAVMPNTVWKEHRSRIAGSLDGQLFERLVWFYGMLEIDRSRWLLASQMTPAPVLPSASAMELIDDVLELGRLREGLEGARSRPGQSVSTRAEKIGECFMKVIDRFTLEDFKDGSLITKARCVSSEIARMRHDGGAWLDEVEQRLRGGG